MLGIDARVARWTWTAAAVLLLLFTIYLIRETLFIFTISLLLAYLLYPLMDLLDRRLPTRTRTPALALTYLLFFGVVSIFAVYIGTVAAEQATNLTKEAPAFMDRLQHAPPSGPQQVQSLKQQVIGAIQKQVVSHYPAIANSVPALSLRVLSASRNLIYLVIIPILSFFILRDGRGIRDSFLEMLDGSRQTMDDTLQDIHTLLLQYMRALLFLCLATFVTFSIVLSTMGVPYSMLLASIAFPLEFIPLVGPLLAAGIIIAVSIFSGFPHLAWVLAFLGLYRMFQDYVLSPHLMSKGVELHPLMVIFGVFAGGEIGGVPGIFLSVPVLALVRLLFHRLRKTRIVSRPMVSVT